MTNGVNGFHSRTMTDDWEQALASGNGRQGVLSYGGPAGLRFTFSHERLFLPLHEPLDPPHTATILPELRRLLAAGRFQAAADAVRQLAIQDNPGYADTRDSDRFVGAATLTIVPALTGAPEATEYRRSVDFHTGVASQRWRAGDVELGADAFVSRPDDVVVIRVTATPLPTPPHPSPRPSAPIKEKGTRFDLPFMCTSP